MSIFRFEQSERGPKRPALPEGLRIHAVGDIHGRIDLLEGLQAELRYDFRQARPERSVEIFLGDYIDRGPNSREVLDWLIDSPPCCDTRICLMGNHEDMALKALADPAGVATWLLNGGLETMACYMNVRPDLTMEDAHHAFRAAFPERHRAFLAALPRKVGFGDYLFVHAGIDPMRPLDQQDPDDLIWIRGRFLSSEEDFGCVVVHGHTPVDEPDVRRNRINIDTGAFINGRLTGLVLENDMRRFLQVEAG